MKQSHIDRLNTAGSDLEALLSERVRRSQPHEDEDVMRRETKIASDEPLPGELVLIVLFALFLVLVISLLLG